MLSSAHNKKVETAKAPFTLWGYLVLLFSVLSLFGCNKYLEEKKKDSTIRIQQAEMQCLQEFPAQMKTYLEDALDRPGIDAMTDCVRTALLQFTQLTRGVREGAYTSEELRHFFNRYFLKNNQVTTELMEEFMKLKVMFFGGNNTDLDRKEIQQMVDALERLRVEGHSFQGQWKLLLFAEQPENVTLARLSQLQTKAIHAIQNFLQVSKVDLSVYEWADFQKFLNELEKFLGGPEHMQQVRKWLPIVDRVKTSFMGVKTLGSSEQDRDEQTEWVGRAYFLSLKFFYLMRDFSFESPEYAQKSVQFVDELISLIEDSPQLRHFGFISFEQLDALIIEVWKLNLFKTEVTLDIFKDSIHSLVWSFIEGRQAQNASSVTSLDRRAWATLRFEFTVWKTPILFFARLFQKTQDRRLPIQEVVRQMQGFDMEKNLQSWGLGNQERIEALRAWDDFTMIMTQKHPPVWVEGGFYVVSDRDSSAWVDFRGLARTATYRTFTRFILRGYGDRSSPELWHQNVTRENLIALENHFRTFGLQAKILDPRQRNPASRTFLEGKFFPLSTDGDNTLSASEILEMMHLLFSGGQSSASRLWELAKNEADCAVDQTDVFGEKYVKVGCLKKVFKSSSEAVLKGLPSMVSFIRAMDNETFSAFMDNLMEVSRAPVEKDLEVFSYADARGAMTLLYYIECLMLSYDVNKDQVLSDNELYRAATRFQSLLEKVDPKYWREGFVFLLKTGRVPVGREKFGVFVDYYRNKVFDPTPEPPPADVKWSPLTTPTQASKGVGRFEILRSMKVLRTYLK